jgi:hypothetical protein
VAGVSEYVVAFMAGLPTHDSSSGGGPVPHGIGHRVKREGSRPRLIDGAKRRRVEEYCRLVEPADAFYRVRSSSHPCRLTIDVFCQSARSSLCCQDPRSGSSFYLQISDVFRHMSHHPPMGSASRVSRFVRCRVVPRSTKCSSPTSLSSTPGARRGCGATVAGRRW